MVQKIGIFQVYYEEKQREKIEFQPYFNQYCTEFFENSVIKNLIIDRKEYLNYEYIGILSHDLRRKCPEFSYEILNSKIYGEYKLFDQKMPDVIILNKKPNHTDILKYAETYHPGFIKIFLQLLRELKLPLLHDFEFIVYSNHFVAKSELYQEYVRNILMPAMYKMQFIPGIWSDSNYFKKLPDHLAEKWNIKYYPFHPFICERLFSYYIKLNNIQCAYL